MDVIKKIINKTLSDYISFQAFKDIIQTIWKVEWGVKDSKHKVQLIQRFNKGVFFYKGARTRKKRCFTCKCKWWLYEIMCGISVHFYFLNCKLVQLISCFCFNFFVRNFGNWYHFLGYICNSILALLLFC